jgi:hypothetical protein
MRPIYHERDLANDLGTTGVVPGQLVAGFAEVDLHGLPIEPVAVALSEDQAAVKALELILTRSCRDGELHGKPRLEFGTLKMRGLAPFRSEAAAIN